MFTGTCGDMRALFSRLRGSGPYSVSLTEYLHRDFSLVDVVRDGCSKGAALRVWAERRGLRSTEVMAVGDNLNDLDMLEYAGAPVVMGNAVAELKARGWRITSSNDEGGVCDTIETLVLRKAS